MTGSVSTIVAASLETSGYYMQHILLQRLDEGLGNAIGAFFFVMAGVVALITIALGKEYKFYRWFIIGPIIYLAMLSESTWSPADTTVWQLGNKKYPHDKVNQALEGVFSSDAQVLNSELAEDAGNDVKVAWFFKEWNRFSSSIINAVIALMRVDANHLDEHFLNQAKTYERFFRAQIQNPGLKEFVDLSLTGSCQKYFENVRLAADSKYMRKDTKQYEADAKALGGNPGIVAGDTSITINTNSRLARYDAQGKELEGISLIDAINQAIPTGQDATQEEASGRKIYVDGNGNFAGGSITCSELREVLKNVLDIYQEEVIYSLITFDGKIKPGTDEYERAQDRLTQKFNAAEGKNKVEVMRDELSIRMMVKAIQKIDPRTGHVYSGTRAIEIDQRYMQTMVRPDIPTNISTIALYEKWRSLGKIQAIGLTLPYIQGMLLFFLAMFFPLFVIVMIINGRHHTLFTWMALWFWIKAWDIGYAVLMVLDSVLYKLFPSGAEFSKTSSTEDAILAFKQILGVDPTYQITMYYDLMGACLISIPVITGMLAKKASGAIMDGIDNSLNSFGNAMGTGYRSRITSLKIMENIGDIEFKAHQDAISRIGEAYEMKNLRSDLEKSNLSDYQMALAEKAMTTGAWGTMEKSLEKLSESENFKEYIQTVGVKALEGVTRDAEIKRLAAVMDSLIARNNRILDIQYAISKDTMEVVKQNVMIGWTQNHLRYFQSQYPDLEFIQPFIEEVRLHYDAEKIPTENWISKHDHLQQSVSKFFGKDYFLHQTSRSIQSDHPLFSAGGKNLRSYDFTTLRPVYSVEQLAPNNSQGVNIVKDETAKTSPDLQRSSSEANQASGSARGTQGVAGRESKLKENLDDTERR